MAWAEVARLAFEAEQGRRFEKECIYILFIEKYTRKSCNSFAMCIAGYIWLTFHIVNVLSDVIYSCRQHYSKVEYWEVGIRISN
jgi:hypothetical protein